MKRCAAGLVLAAAVAVLPARPARAGNPSIVTVSGQPGRWPSGGRGIVFLTDQGPFGSSSNAEATDMVVTGFRRWEDIPTASATFIDGGTLPFDVDGTNWRDVAFAPPDGTNPVVFDSDGSILEQIFGGDSGVLGLTLVSYRTDTGELLRSVVFLGGTTPPSQYLAVTVHELGHLAGLDHSVVNGQLVLGDESGPTPHDTFGRPASFDGLIETMNPFIYFPMVIAGGQDTPDADDAAIFSALYPEPDFAATTGAVSGRVLTPLGEPLTGVNVIARNLADPFGNAVSALSGSFAAHRTADDPEAGVFTLHGLRAGAQYALFVDEIIAGGFNTPPATLSGREEFWNGADESDGGERADDPAAFVPLTAAAGQTLGGVDVILNRVRPGPLPIGHSESIELPLRFGFSMCGQTFRSVFVNANGTLSFGRRDFGGFNTPLQFLEGPAMVAGLRAELVPGGGGPGGGGPGGGGPGGGGVAFDETAESFTVSFTGVPAFDPRFGPVGSNTFTITLSEGDGDRPGRATVAYDSVDAHGALAGYSCGEGMNTLMERPSDLTRMPGGRIRGHGQTAIYQVFDPVRDDLDLDGRTLRYDLPGGFPDPFEPNDTLGSARRVTLPFQTRSAFAELHPGDVDFYRFRARAGDVLVAETHPGTALDTVLGLFQVGRSGAATRLGTNDDTAGLFSRLVVGAPTDGEYVLAVGTFPDTSFTGAGQASGRYVLTVDAYHGEVLPLGDDDAMKVRLPFAFPYQGKLWRSVWVGSDGNLTFGAADADSSPRDVGRFLSGPPRIAPLFDDLDPSGASTGIPGLVIAATTTDAVAIHWVSVPEFAGFETNTFSVLLQRDGDVRLEWGAMALDVGLSSGPDLSPVMGLTEGGGAADTGSTDLSDLRHGRADGTTYQNLGAMPFDLYFGEVEFLRGRRD